MKVYTWFEEGYWFSNACDCCEDIYMRSYNSDEADISLGSAEDDLECFILSIITEIGRKNIQEDYEEKLWEMSLEELKQESANLNITVEFE